jgi:hypothetical protein
VASRPEPFVSLTFYTEPVEGTVETNGPRSNRFSDLFARGWTITMNAAGGMAVSPLDHWPRSCPRVPPATLAELSRSWDPVLDWEIPPRAVVVGMANPYPGPGWRPDGPLLSLQIGSASGKHLQILWDGRTPLPGPVEAAVLDTLETFCAHSWLARRSLRRDLPPPAASRLGCGEVEAVRSR